VLTIKFVANKKSIPNAKHCAHSLSVSRASKTILLEESEAIRFLGSARRAQLFNDPHSVAAIDYIPKTF
jgi:hypothetical protein